MSLLPRFVPSYGKKEASCMECLGKRTFVNHAEFTDHLVNEHGYIRLGESAYKHRLCHCGKTGLYKVGVLVFCSDHYREAEAKRVKCRERFEARAAIIEKQKKRKG